MDMLLLFFAIPLAVIILSIVLQRILRCPLLVAATTFAIFLIITFAIGDINLLIYTLVYTIISYITAQIVRIISEISSNGISLSNVNAQTISARRVNANTVRANQIIENNVDLDDNGSNGNNNDDSNSGNNGNNNCSNNCGCSRNNGYWYYNSNRCFRR